MYGRQRVVTGDHAAGEVGAAEGLDGWCRARLELILEDDKAEEAETGFGLLSGQGIRDAQLSRKMILTASYAAP